MLTKKIVKKSLNDTNGFTMMELMITIAIIGVLSAIAIANYTPMRSKTYDASAHADARNLMSAVISAASTDVDVDYMLPAIPANIRAIGSQINGGGLRTTRIFTLSEGVRARIVAGTSQGGINGNNTMFQAYIYHIGGTADASSLLTGKKEYYCYIDGDIGESFVPEY